MLKPFTPIIKLTLQPFQLQEFNSKDEKKKPQTVQPMLKPGGEPCFQDAWDSLQAWTTDPARAGRIYFRSFTVSSAHPRHGSSPPPHQFTKVVTLMSARANPNVPLATTEGKVNRNYVSAQLFTQLWPTVIEMLSTVLCDYCCNEFSMAVISPLVTGSFRGGVPAWVCTDPEQDREAKELTLRNGTRPAE